MKNLINLNENIQSYGFAPPKYYALSSLTALGGLAGIGSVVSGGSSIAGTAANVAMQAQTNAMNERLTREGWDRQSDEAEKAREFNANEAEKAREYYSESEQVKRREDAGLNTAMVASNSATTGASASGSPASLSSPIPAQSPQIDGSALGDALSNYFGFKTAESNISKAGAETKRLYQQIEFEKASNKINLNILNTTLDNLSKAGELTSKQIEQAQTTINAEKHKVSIAKVGLFNEWMSDRMSSINQTFNSVNGLHIIEVNYEKLSLYTQELRARLHMFKTETYTQWRKRLSATDNRNVTEGRDFNQQDGSSSKWNLGGELSAKAGNGIIGGSVNVNGGYESSSSSVTSQGTSSSVNTGYSEQFEEYFVDTRAGQLLCEVDACVSELDDVINKRGKYTTGDWRELRNYLINRITEINTSYETWEMLYYNKAHTSTRKDF